MPQVTVTFEHGIGAKVKAKRLTAGEQMKVVGLHVRPDCSKWIECEFVPSGCACEYEWRANQLEPWPDEHESEKS